MSEPFEPRQRHWIEYAATLGALIVSVISLWVAIATEKANQKMVDANYRMVAAASWPFLQINSSNRNYDKRRIILSLENAGVGPAKIQSFEVFWRGKAYGSSAALLRACCTTTTDPTTWFAVTQPVQGLVMRAGEGRNFLSLDPTPANEAMWTALDRVRLHELTYRACYCSVFDECWISSLAKLQAQRVKACPTPATPYRQ